MPTALWLHQFPHGEPRWGNCHFLFDQHARDYDWLVVYDDIPEKPGEARKRAHEELACAPEHTLLVTTEPSSIKIYGNDFTRQFGAVLTSQAAWALPHRQRIYSQPGSHWFYGIGSQHVTPFDELLVSPSNKNKTLSMVFSSKSMRHTLHHRRAALMQGLMQRLPEMDVFGRGTAHALDDKADCLRDYRYHVAIENFIGEHHWTEKLADAFLGEALPFYAGCPNAAAYFPAESFIPIDMRDIDSSVATIRQAIADNAYQARLPAIREARRRVLYEYNIFAVLAREIACRHSTDARPVPRTRILSRRAMRSSSPIVTLRDLYGKARGRLRHWLDAF